jgi:hypothetical protein
MTRASLIRQVIAIGLGEIALFTFIIWELAR